MRADILGQPLLDGCPPCFRQTSERAFDRQFAKPHPGIHSRINLFLLLYTGERRERGLPLLLVIKQEYIPNWHGIRFKQLTTACHVRLTDEHKNLKIFWLLAQCDRREKQGKEYEFAQVHGVIIQRARLRKFFE